MPPKRMSRFKLIYLAPALALIALTAWALASPIGSSPDDDFHLVSTWCASESALCEPGPSADTRVVPEALVKARCFTPAIVDATCNQTPYSLDPTDTRVTSRGNFAGSYPPVYYATMHLFAGDNILLSVFFMRLANIVLFVGLTTALFALLPRDRRPSLLWAWTVTTLPLGLFLIASNNPSSWSIIGIGTAWIALLGYFETAGRRKVGLGAVFGVATLMAAGARADSAIYAVLAIGAVFVLKFAFTRRFLLDAILPVVSAVVSIGFFLSSRQATSGLNGFGDSGVSDSGTAAEIALTPGRLLFSNLVNVPSLWAGVFGSYDLGWFDAPVPELVSLGALACFVVVVFLGLSTLTWRKGLVLAGIGAVLWALPVFVLVRGGDPVGQEVQPRYLLPLIIVLAGVATLAVGKRAIRLGRAQWVLIASTLALAHGAGLYYVMRRYVNGNAGGLDLNHGVQWWWHMSLPPAVVLVAGSLAYAALVVVLLRDLNGKPRMLVGQTEVNRGA